MNDSSKPRLPTRTATALFMIAVALVAGCSTNKPESTSHRVPNTPSTVATSPTSTVPPGESAAIIAENKRPGTTDWQIQSGDDRPRGIEGFADTTSVEQGGRVGLYVSTGARSFTATAYRIGFYGGAGGRQVWKSPLLTGVHQPTCPTDPKTRMVACNNWSRAIEVPITKAFVPGEYLIKLVPSTGTPGYIPLVVRDDSSHAAVLVISSVTTTQAYNTWGGHSLYTGTGNGSLAGRAYVVSFDRPFASGWGQSGWVLGDTGNTLQLLESMGVDVTYATDIDVHQHPELLANHRVVISGSHDEYYSSAMRKGVLDARAKGVNFIFLGANAMYRHIRLESSPLGPDRVEVNYRVAHLDPLNGVNPAEVTTQWGDPPVPRPENAITGDTYTCNQSGLTADMVVVNALPWMWAGTGVTNGTHLAGMVREEYDRMAMMPGVPVDDELITHSPLVCRGKASYSDMTYYTVPSGAAVLDVGTLLFEPHLGPMCPAAVPGGPVNTVNCAVSRMIYNVVKVFAEGPAGKAHPSVANGAAFGVPKSSPAIGGD